MVPSQSSHLKLVLLFALSNQDRPGITNIGYIDLFSKREHRDTRAPTEPYIQALSVTQLFISFLE